METLLQGVNEARSTLKAVGAEAELFNNVSVVAQLVSKLSGSHQGRWHQEKTSTDFIGDQRKTGEKFLGWIERQGAAAVSARLTCQALALSKPQQSAPRYRNVECAAKEAIRLRVVQEAKAKGSSGGSPGIREPL